MKKSVILFMFFSVIINKTFAQQNSLFNTYSLDPLQLNIAYAGAVCTEANVHYRTQWIGLQNAPKLLQLNAHTALGKSNAIALKVNSQTQGLLNTLGATLGYSYRIKVSETAKVHLGIGVGWTQAALNAQKTLVVDGNDNTLNNSSKQTANGFDSEFGIMFIGKKLKTGISALHLYNSNPSFSGNSTYKTLPQLNTQVSYTFNKDKKIELEPWVLSRYTLKGDNVIEGMLNINFIKTITIGAGYRSNYGILALVGAKLGNLKLAYSFDYGTTKNATNLGTSHQIMLGFSMCKTAKTPKPKEEPIVSTPTHTVQPIVIEPKEEPKKEEVVVKEEPKIKPIVEVKKSSIQDINNIAESISFGVGKTKLDAVGLKKIELIADVLKKNPDLKMSVEGRASPDGNKALNDALSLKRAEYVKTELIKRGVNPDNIKGALGVGSDKATSLQKNSRTVRFVGTN